MPSRIGAETAAKCAAVWDDVLERVRDGEFVSAVAKSHGLTRSMLWAYRNGSNELRAQWAEAMVDSSDALAEDAGETVRNPAIDPKRAHVIAQQLMLMAEKRDPARYGKQTNVNLRQTLAVAPILAEVDARLARLRQAALGAQDVVPLGVESLEVDLSITANALM